MTQRIIDHEKAEILRLTREFVHAFGINPGSETSRRLGGIIVDRLCVVDRFESRQRGRARASAARKRAKTKRAKLRAEKARAK